VWSGNKGKLRKRQNGRKRRKETEMNYECIESKRDHGWAVEAINHEGEGEISRVLFMGLNAEALAHEYERWKNADQRIG
jgi:hypothetical protein